MVLERAMHTFNWYLSKY